jgi:hypothetical protein
MAGYKNGELGADKPDEILFISSGQSTKTITLAPSARDATSPLGNVYLRQGLILVPITSGPETGMYRHFNDGATDGTENEEDAVVLKNLVKIGDVNQAAAAWVAGNFKADRLIVAGTFDWSAVQRIIRHPIG